MIVVSQFFFFARATANTDPSPVRILLALGIKTSDLADAKEKRQHKKDFCIVGSDPIRDAKEKKTTHTKNVISECNFYTFAY